MIKEEQIIVPTKRCPKHGDTEYFFTFDCVKPPVSFCLICAYEWCDEHLRKVTNEKHSRHI